MSRVIQQGQYIKDEYKSMNIEINTMINTSLNININIKIYAVPVLV